MRKYIYLRGTYRNTTLSLLKKILNDIYEDVDKKTLFKMLTKKLMKGVVIVHDDQGWNALFLTLLKNVGGYKIVIRLRGDAFNVLKHAPYLFSYYPRVIMTRFILRRADYILFNSKHLRNQKAYKFFKKKSGVAYNPLMIEHQKIDIHSLNNKRRSTPEFHLLTITNFHFPQKIAPLIMALTKWIDPYFLERYNIKWDVIGDGYYLKDFKDKVNIERFNGRVAIHGYCKDTIRFYKKSHICVYLSGLDAFPNVVLEASYCGLPIITNPGSCGTLEAIIEGETGEIVSNSKEFKKTIIHYKDNPYLREKHGIAARDYILRNFTIEKQQDVATQLLFNHFK